MISYPTSNRSKVDKHMQTQPSKTIQSMMHLQEQNGARLSVVVVEHLVRGARPDSFFDTSHGACPAQWSSQILKTSAGKRFRSCARSASKAAQVSDSGTLKTRSPCPSWMTPTP